MVVSTPKGLGISGYLMRKSFMLLEFTKDQ